MYRHCNIIALNPCRLSLVPPTKESLCTIQGYNNNIIRARIYKISKINVKKRFAFLVSGCAARLNIGHS